MDVLDLVIRNGTVVTATDTMACDLGIKDGLIAALGRNLGPSRREIDAAGLLVLPGGIDSHCHIDQVKQAPPPFADGFASGTAAAAHGGNTCIISFTPQFKGKAIKPFVQDYHRRAEQSVIDYSFHLNVTDPSAEVLNEDLPELISHGYRSLKIFMTYNGIFVNDGQILDILGAARQHGALVVVHAENNDSIRWLTGRLENAGMTAPRYHAFSKPPVVEREAIHRIIALAEIVDQPIHIFHVSSAQGVEEIRRAQQRGLKVFAETCPQYLAFTDSDLDRPNLEGAKYICSPALRKPEDQEALWQAIDQGIIQVISSDHAPFPFEGPDGKKHAGSDAPFSSIPNGMPGIELRLPYLFSEGVGKGRIDINKFVALTSTNPAKLYGLYPRKGSIAVGMDADIAIWDPKASREVRVADLHENVDHTPYEGMPLTGWPVTTLVRGTVVTAAGRLEVKPGFGRFIGRDPYPAIRPRGVFANGFNPFAAPIPAVSQTHPAR